MQYLCAISKMIDGLRSFARQTIQHHSNPSLCPNHWYWRSWSGPVLLRPTTSRMNTKKGCPFHHSGLECKIRKSRDTQNNRQVWSWSTKWRQQSLTALSREHAGQSKHPFPTTQEMTAPRHHQMVNTEIRLCSLKPKMEKLLLYSQQKQELELTVAQIISSLLQNSASDWYFHSRWYMF